ncbi:MAG: hypothetical protein F2813_09065 [Actinobacteria bacterium]|uniref:Unannotated protein n=1 Tax=freshwater metagenome TaxID=449393 RepID=A0A6J6A7A5_9ZZZZ|nr:hypothetical protein [Actinomycetota bacterium]
MGDRADGKPLIRVALVLLSIAAIALGAVWFKSARDQQQISRLYQTNDVVVLANSSAEVSRLANPSLPVYPNSAGRLMEAVVAYRLGNPPKSRAILESVVAREPENAQAWTLLEIVDRFTDLAGAKRARERLLELDPLFGEAP